jgi:transposase
MGMCDAAAGVEVVRRQAVSGSALAAASEVSAVAVAEPLRSAPEAAPFSPPPEASRNSNSRP